MTDVSASLTWIAGLKFVATMGTGHSVVIDGPEQWGGTNAGPFNAELVAAALGGCSGMDVVKILEKKRRGCEKLQITVETTLSDERPSSLRDFTFVCRAWGGAARMEDLEEALTLSLEKYCVVAHSLKGRIHCVAFLNDEPSPRFGPSQL